MAQEGGPNEVGQMSVGIGADLTGLRSALKQGEQEVQQSAQKMAQSAVVPIGNKSGAAGIGGAGAAGVGGPGVMVPIGLGANEAKARALAGGPRGVGPGGSVPIPPVPEKTQQSLKEATRNVTILTRGFGLMVSAAGAVVSAINAVSQAVDFLNTRYGDGRKKAEEYIKGLGGIAVGGEAASRQLGQVNDKLIEVQSELARLQEGEGRAAFGRSRGTIEAELKRLNEYRTALANQVKAAAYEQRRNAQAKQIEDDAEIARGELKVKWEKTQAEVARLNREDTERRMRIDKIAQDQAEYADEKQMDRLKRIGSTANAMARENPFFANAQDIEQIKDTMAKAIKNARDPVEALLAAQFGAAVIKGLEKDRSRMVAAFRDIIGDGINGALQQQANANGVQNTAFLLRDIGVVVQGIKASLPREYTGPVPGLPPGVQ